MLLLLHILIIFAFIYYIFITSIFVLFINVDGNYSCTFLTADTLIAYFHQFLDAVIQEQLL